MINCYYHYKTWSVSAIECYKRGCVCRGCYYQKFFTDTKCKMKATVIELVRLHGAPKTVKLKQILEDK